jgi:hypothetical protein
VVTESKIKKKEHGMPVTIALILEIVLVKRSFFRVMIRRFSSMRKIRKVVEILFRVFERK